MYNCNPTVTPAETSVNLVAASQSDDKPYRQLIGALLYLATGSRPDIAYIVGRLSSFLDRHGEEHWLAAKRVLRYLKGTINTGIRMTFVPGHNYPLELYGDAD